KGDRDIDTQVIAVTHEVGMLRYFDGDQNVAYAAWTRQSLPLKADLLALAESGRNLDIDLLAGGQSHAPGRALSGFGERNGNLGRHIVAGRLHLFGRNARVDPPAAARSASEHAVEQIIEAGKPARPARTRRALRPK